MPNILCEIPIRFNYAINVFIVFFLDKLFLPEYQYILQIHVYIPFNIFVKERYIKINKTLNS